MSRMKRTIWWSLCVLPLLVVVPLLIAQSARIDDATLRRAGQTGDDWLTYGLNQSETRFSPLKDIDTTNVSRLGLAWSVDLKSGGGDEIAENQPQDRANHPLNQAFDQDQLDNLLFRRLE